MSITCPACLTENPDGTFTCIACGYSPLTSSSTGNSTSAYHLSIGAMLKQEKYRIEQVLGEGGFGITYKATNLHQNLLTVAIKELWPEKAARNNQNIISWPGSITPQGRLQQIKKFQLESQYLSSCVHPHIIQVYDWFEENNTAYLVMEYVAGKSLYQIFRDEGKLTEQRTKRYFLQIGEALKVVHVKFLHRDIKPDNILVDGSDRAVLIDFGATKEFIAGLTQEMSRTLSPGYAPLEQYSYRSKRYAATDIYALCASMYELLTGQVPTPAIDRANQDPLIPPRQLRSDLSAQMERVLLTGLNMRVEDRFQTVDELLDALDGKFVSPQLKRARELVEQSKLPEAVKVYETCVAAEDNTEAAIELALVQLYLSDAQAEQAAQQAIQLKPSDGRGYGVLGLLDCRRSRWADATQHLSQAAHLAPSEAWIQANLAWALGKSARWQEAKLAAETAIQLDANCTFAQGVKAWIASNLQDWKEAIRSAKPAIFQSKKMVSRESQELRRWVYPHLLVALDRAILTQGSQDVERCLQEFMGQFPDSAFPWGFKGWQAASQGEWASAQASFQQASRQPQVPDWIWRNLGVIYEQAQNIPEAIQAYQACRQQLPKSFSAHFRLGTLLAQQGQWTQAIALLEQAIELDPNSAPAYHNLAWALFQLKDEDGQVQDTPKLFLTYRRAIELYEQQREVAIAQAIRQRFQVAGVSLD